MQSSKDKLSQTFLSRLLAVAMSGANLQTHGHSWYSQNSIKKDESWDKFELICFAGQQIDHSSASLGVLKVSLSLSFSRD